MSVVYFSKFLISKSKSNQNDITNQHRNEHYYDTHTGKYVFGLMKCALYISREQNLKEYPILAVKSKEILKK